MISRNKKGSVTVFLMVFFTGLLIAVMAFVTASKEKAVASSAQCLGNLYAGSVLAEYDRDLFERYSVLGFCGESEQIANRLRYYSGKAAKGKKYAKVQVCNVHLSDYSLSNEKLFRKQVVKAGLMVEGEKLLSYSKRKDKGEKKDGEVAYEEFSRQKDFGEIRNDAILGALPSKGTSNGFSPKRWAEALQKIGSPSDIAQGGKESFFINCYVDGYFRDFIHDKNMDDTFFKGEMEYILFGKPSDRKNRNRTKAAIVAVREVVNLAWLKRHPEKTAAVKAALSLLGAAEKPAEEAVLASWALFESENDYRLLMHGKPVPLEKTDDTWAVDLQSVLDNTAYNYIDTGNQEGLVYEDYIKTFMCLMSRETRMLRIMDLVQINMKYNYNGDFLLQDCHEGVSFNLKVNGRDHVIEDRY